MNKFIIPVVALVVAIGAWVYMVWFNNFIEATDKGDVVTLVATNGVIASKNSWILIVTIVAVLVASFFSVQKESAGVGESAGPNFMSFLPIIMVFVFMFGTILFNQDVMDGRWRFSPPKNIYLGSPEKYRDSFPRALVNWNADK